jgi:hypothetical protein
MTKGPGMPPKDKIMGNNKWDLKTLVMLILFGLLFVLATGSKAEAKAGTEDLQRKIADITLLKQQLGDRRQQAEDALEALLKQQDEFMAEARLLIKSLKIKSIQEAQKNLRLHYGIELLRIIRAYSQAFESKIRFYQTGRDKLTYLLQLAQDDIKMVTTLSGFEIDALTTQISLVVNQYLGQAHNIQIAPPNMDAISAESIWESIMAAR